jgi:hypothetical protein
VNPDSRHAVIADSRKCQAPAVRRQREGRDLRERDTIGQSELEPDLR